jgi:hypothetical protein
MLATMRHPANDTVFDGTEGGAPWIAAFLLVGVVAASGLHQGLLPLATLLPLLAVIVVTAWIALRKIAAGQVLVLERDGLALHRPWSVARVRWEAIANIEWEGAIGPGAALLVRFVGGDGERVVRLVPQELGTTPEALQIALTRGWDSRGLQSLQSSGLDRDAVLAAERAAWVRIAAVMRPDPFRLPA